HGAGDRCARPHLMGERADVLERTHRINHVGKARLLFASVDMQDLDRPPGNALDRVKHDESGSVGEDVRLGLGDRFELKRSVALAAYSRVIDKLLLGVRTGGAIADGELAGTLADLQVVDLRRVGAPVFVAN